MEPRKIYEDQALIVVDKPSGWIVNAAGTTGTQPVVQSWLKGLAYPLAKSQEARSGIVHRLDKETSGILLIAKTKEVFEDLQGQFKKRGVKKTYLALVHGRVEPEKGSLEVPVGRLPWRRDRFGVLPGGRTSKTSYRVAGSYTKEGENFSLVEAHPETGRTHQIRIHLKYLGHPIVGDEFYAGRKTARQDRVWCPRLFLHATGIEFTHPTKGCRVSFESALPSDLSSVIKSLTKS
jgi:23S rRNA pseudouridine1911/1915/1917 synthase